MINVHQVYMFPAITKKDLLSIRAKSNMSELQAGTTLAIINIKYVVASDNFRVKKRKCTE